MLLPGRGMLDAAVVLLLSVAAVYGCPQNIGKKVNHCLIPYKNFYNSIIDDRTSLFTGIDVENLRSICVQVQAAFACVTNIERTCPYNKREVFKAFGETITMVELCNKGDLYEKYAVSQNCFARQKHATSRCHRTFTTATSPLLVGVRNTQMSAIKEYCSHMETLFGCVNGELESCGIPINKHMVEALVKPTVHMGHICNNPFVVPLTTPSGGNGRKSTKDNGAAALNGPFWAIAVTLTLLQVLHLHTCGVLVLR